MEHIILKESTNGTVPSVEKYEVFAPIYLLEIKSEADDRTERHGKMLMEPPEESGSPNHGGGGPYSARTSENDSETHKKYGTRVATNVGLNSKSVLGTVLSEKT